MSDTTVLFLISLVGYLAIGVLCAYRFLGWIDKTNWVRYPSLYPVPSHDGVDLAFIIFLGLIWPLGLFIWVDFKDDLRKYEKKLNDENNDPSVHWLEEKNRAHDNSVEPSDKEIKAAIKSLVKTRDKLQR